MGCHEVNSDVISNQQKGRPVFDVAEPFRFSEAFHGQVQ